MIANGHLEITMRHNEIPTAYLSRAAAGSRASSSKIAGGDFVGNNLANIPAGQAATAVPV